MDKEYWHQRWQANDIGFNQAEPNKLMQCYFSELKLTPGSRVFIPLCGQSIDMLWLMEQGYKVIGVELSQIACHAFFSENNIPFKIKEIDNFIVYESKTITIFCGDLFNLHFENSDAVDAVYDRAALVALPENTRKTYSKHVVRLMTPKAGMLLITIKYNQNEMQGPPFSLEKTEVLSLYHDHFLIKELYSKPFQAPEHLQVKGLMEASEEVYLLTPK